MRTLERKKSSAGRSNGHPFNGSYTNGGNGSQHNRGGGGGVNQINSSNRQEKNEFDDLISALRTGDVFGESVDKFTQKRWSSTRGHHSERFHGVSSSGKVRHSPPRVDRTDSFLRERISSNPKNMS